MLVSLIDVSIYQPRDKFKEDSLVEFLSSDRYLKYLDKKI